MVETPDGHGRLELTKFHTPVGPGRRPARAGESGANGPDDTGGAFRPPRSGTRRARALPHRLTSAGGDPLRCPARTSVTIRRRRDDLFHSGGGGLRDEAAMSVKSTTV